MYDGFEDQFYTDDIPLLLLEMHDIVRQHWRLKAEGKPYGGEVLEKQLYALIEEKGSRSLNDWREMIRVQEEWHDDYLNLVNETFRQILLGDQPVQRAYVVRTKCTSCEKDRQYQHQVVPVSDYVFERDFNPLMPSGELYDNGLQLMCQHGCGVPVHVVSSGNLMIPRREPLHYVCEKDTFGKSLDDLKKIFAGDDPLFSRLMARVKASQGKVQKAGKLICYDPENDDHKFRSLADRFALQQGINDSLEEKLDQLFYGRFGLNMEEAAKPAIVLGQRSRVPANKKISLEKFRGLKPSDRMHYAVIGYLMRMGETRGFSYTPTFDDKLVVPKKSGYKSVQAHLRYKGKLFEQQVKSESIVLGETLKGTGVNHLSYHETEWQIYLTTIDKEVEPIVTRILWRLWGDRNKFDENIRRVIKLQNVSEER